jgi:hypothetical protein
MDREDRVRLWSNPECFSSAADASPGRKLRVIIRRIYRSPYEKTREKTRVARFPPTKSPTTRVLKLSCGSCHDAHPPHSFDALQFHPAIMTPSPSREHMPTFTSVRVGLWGRLPMAAKGLGTRRTASPMCGEPGGGHRLLRPG